MCCTSMHHWHSASLLNRAWSLAGDQNFYATCGCPQVNLIFLVCKITFRFLQLLINITSAEVLYLVRYSLMTRLSPGMPVAIFFCHLPLCSISKLTSSCIYYLLTSSLMCMAAFARPQAEVNSIRVTCSTGIMMPWAHNIHLIHFYHLEHQPPSLSRPHANRLGVFPE